MTDPYNVLPRLEALENQETESRLEYIEKLLRGISLAQGAIDAHFKNGVKLIINNEDLNIIEALKKAVQEIFLNCKSLYRASEDLRKLAHDDSLIGTVRFMAKELAELRKTVEELKKKGVPQQLDVAVTLDGYEMTKRSRVKEKMLKDIYGKIEKEDPHKYLKEALEKIDPIYAIALTYRYGLFDGKMMTYAQVAQTIGICLSTATARCKAGIIRLRNPKLRKIVNKITHDRLRKEIFGDED